MSNEQRQLVTKGRDRYGRLFFLLAWLVGSALFWGVRGIELPLLRGPDGLFAMSEADAYVRMMLVRDAVAGGRPVRVRFLDADNAPFGRINEWTSPTTILGVWLTRAVRRVTNLPLEPSLRIGMLMLGPLVGWGALSVCGWLGYLLGGWPLALCWMLPLSISPDVLTITRFGNGDHHGLHFFLFVTSAALAVVSERRAVPGAGVMLGIFCGMALWSAGSELLPLIVLIGALAVFERGFSPQGAQYAAFWRGWYVAGFLTTLGALMYEFYPAPVHSQLEMVSPAHVLLWAVLAWILEHTERDRGMLACALHLAVGAAIMIVAVGLLKNWRWDQLHVIQDPFFQREAGITREFEPWARTLGEWLRSLWSQFGALPILALIGLAAFFRDSPRVRWLKLATLFYVTLACYQYRWLDFAAPLLILSAGLAALDLCRRRPAWAPLLVILCSLPLARAPWNLHRQIAGATRETLLGPFQEAFALEAACRCVGNENEKPVMLAPWFQGSVLLGSGQVRAIASPYWSNKQGLRDGALMFATRSPAEFWREVKRRNVAYILIPDRNRTMRAISQSWILAYGYPPTLEELQQTVIWRIASRNDTPFIRCDELRRLCPDWRVVSTAQLAPPGSDRK